MRPGAGRAVLEAFGVALYALLHAAAAGGLVLAGVGLAAPGVVDVTGPAEAVTQSVAFGLASLRVTLESGGLEGTFAPLTGLALALWGLVSGSRKILPSWPGGRVAQVAALAVAFGATCALAAAVAGSAPGLAPSVVGAAVAGLVWGALAGVAVLAGASWRRARALVDPGVVAASVVLALGGVWFLVAAVVSVAGHPFREAAGGILLALAALPNAAAVLAAVGLGSSVDTVLSGTAVAGPVSGSLSLWDWGGRVAPPHVLALALAPVAGAVLGARVAQSLAPGERPLPRGLRTGVVLGAAVALVGWVGSFSAGAGPGSDRVSLRLGFAPLVVVALGLAWGVAGEYLARLPLPSRVRRGPRVAPP